MEGQNTRLLMQLLLNQLSRIYCKDHSDRNMDLERWCVKDTTSHGHSFHLLITTVKCIFLNKQCCTSTQIFNFKLSLTLAHAREGYCSWSVCVLCVCVCEQVFSRAVSAVGTERGGMDKHHGRSVQQETGAALATERRSPAASYSTGCALIKDRACV